MQPAPLLFAAALLGLLAGCGLPEKNPAPNVLLITLDTTRRDHLSAYGYPLPTSPTIEQLARDGVLFDFAYATTATTGPTHASLFTSLYPPAHGVVKNGLVLDERHMTLAEALQDEGYQTAAVVSSFVLDSKFGFAQGFAEYHDDFTVEDSTIKTNAWEDHVVEEGFDRRADLTTGLAQHWLEHRRDPKRPFFLFVHYFDPHSPYVPPEQAALLLGEPDGPLHGLDKTIFDYDAEIAFSDQGIGELLSSLTNLGLSESTVVVVTADHGEGLMQHGHLEHGLHIYEEAVRVPLVARWPGRLPAGRTMAYPAELTDLAPTLLSLTGAASRLTDAQGQDLSSVLLSPEHPTSPPRDVFLFRRYYEAVPGKAAPRGIKTGIRSGKWKYIRGHHEETEELYDLDRDPGETVNLISEYPSEKAELQRRLDEWMRRCWPTNPETTEIDPEDRARLEALGYLD